MKKIVYSLQEINLIVDELKILLEKNKIITFNGSLGVGKTTLIQSLLRSCGIIKNITSPTFAYYNMYQNEQKQVFYHFDLYRIHSIEEFQQLGFDEYLYQLNSRAFVEWPEIILSLLDHNVCHVFLDYHEYSQKRIISIECIE